ncbi:MAG: multicopper oxidase family protein [Polyangiaceae bacterium]|nr:multicopper oxidase family protein [Polyangiaceae bacterium]
MAFATWIRHVALASSIAACASCGDDTAPETPSQPEGFADEIALATVTDLDPDPSVLEVEIEARTVDLDILGLGLPTTVWTYNGSLPGPLLRLRAGDRLIVHFKNSLPQATTVHWHGVRVPQAMDGSPPHSQAPVEPGDTFDYDFVVPDPGLFWFHPHEASAAQLGYGLYGALVVDPAEPEPEGLGDEVVMVLSDMSIDQTTGAMVPADQGGELGALFGREGGVLLVNGKQHPTLHARRGLRQRWRIVNAAKSRYFRLALPGHTFERIGGDTGLLVAPIVQNEILLMPGQRADVVVRPMGEDGERVTLTWLPYDRGYGSVEFREPAPLLDVALAGDTVEPDALPALGGGVAPLDLAGATQVSIALTQHNAPDGSLVLGINGVPFQDAEPIAAEVGETQIWTVTNEMEWAHPFHLHGFFFQRLDESGAFVEPVEWLDTADVPEKGSMRFAVRYDARPGMWMFHCHILDHADLGMMGMVDVRQR